jgi:hypothetical protein
LNLLQFSLNGTITRISSRWLLDGTGEAAIEAGTEDDPTGGVDLYLSW